MTDKTSENKLKKQRNIIRVIIQYSSRNTGTTQLQKGQIKETKNTTINTGSLNLIKMLNLQVNFGEFCE
jgi:hypothetical protein